MDENEQSVRLTNEFIDELNNIAGIHAMALTGIIKMAEFARTLKAPSADSTLFVGHGNPNSQEGLAYQRWPIRTLAERLAPEGPVVRALGQQWIVMVASKWNDHYRALIAKALGIEKNELKDAAMADINRMRNDIVHHRGIASTGNTGRCEALRWFEVGEPLHILPVHVSELMSYMGAIHSTADIEPGALWNERYEPGESQQDDGAEQLAPGMLDMLADVCAFLTKFIDDGTWEPSTPLELLVVATLIRARATYETIIPLAQMGRTAQAASLTESLFEDMLVAHWLVLYKDNPEWLIEQHKAHGNALRLHFANAPGASASAYDISDLAGREQELREQFGPYAEQLWWSIDRNGDPLTVEVLVKRLAGAEEFHPRLRGEQPILEQQYAALRRMTAGPLAMAEEPMGPSSFHVLHTAYWTFAQLVFAALELGARDALEHFERLFLGGLAVFSEAVGVPVPWADQLREWAEAAQGTEDAARARQRPCEASPLSELDVPVFDRVGRCG